MRLGVPREVQDHEYRVALTPAGVRELVLEGHEVIIEQGAGERSSIPDQDFERVGAKIVAASETVFADAELVLKVKEPVESELSLLREGLVLFTFLHLAAREPTTRALMDAGITAVAYETIELDDGSLPLLAPMSEVAGRMAPQIGAAFLERERGGRGILLGGVSGVAPARVVVIGAGMAGMNAAWGAQGMEAEVTILDRDIDKLRGIDRIHRGRILTLASSRLTVEEAIIDADLVVGAILVVGARTPKVVSEAIVKEMKAGAVVIDISIDQGGCFETSRVTTHSHPTFVAHDVLHYCVGNMPGAVPHTSTYALTNSTLPYLLEIARRGIEAAARASSPIARGINIYRGELVSKPVADAHHLTRTPLHEVLRE